MVGVTVVLADGSVVEASEKENPDLFWAIRGAGSNYGIVASWKLRTFPAPETLTWFSVKLNWTAETSLAGLEALEKYARTTMPSNLNFRVSDYDRGSPNVEGLYYGTDSEMRAAIAPLLRDAAPKGVVTESFTVNWLQAAHHYSFFDTIDWTDPSPVSLPIPFPSFAVETDPVTARDLLRQVPDAEGPQRRVGQGFRRLLVEERHAADLAWLVVPAGCEWSPAPPADPLTRLNFGMP